MLTKTIRSVPRKQPRKNGQFSNSQLPPPVPRNDPIMPKNLPQNLNTPYFWDTKNIRKEPRKLPTKNAFNMARHWKLFRFQIQVVLAEPLDGHSLAISLAKSLQASVCSCQSLSHRSLTKSRTLNQLGHAATNPQIDSTTPKMGLKQHTKKNLNAWKA